MARSCHRPTMPARLPGSAGEGRQNGPWCGREWTMTRLSQPTEFRPGSKADRALCPRRARVLAWERLWPMLWPASGIAGLFLAAALFGAFAPLPWPLHALILASFVTAIGVVALFQFVEIRRAPLERCSAAARTRQRLQHRPISEADDALAAGAGDPYAEELWRAHLRLRLQHLGRLRLSRPRLVSTP